MKKESKYEQLSQNIVDLIGGKENISYFSHCITRLRFTVKDRSKVKSKEIEKQPGVVGSQWSGDQYQVIIGQEVGEAYDLICKEAGFAMDESTNDDFTKEKKKFSFSVLFDTLSACIIPILPAFIGTGLIKGVLILLTTYNLVSTESGLYLVLNAVSDAAFYYLPFLMAISAAKKFKTDVMLAAVLAGLYLHPSLTLLIGQSINIFGINVALIKYSSGVIPILVSVWIMSYIYHFLDSHILKSLRVILVPTLTLLIMAPLSIVVIGPLGYYLGVHLGSFMETLYSVSPIIAGFINGATRPIVLLTGMQTMFTPIMINNLTVLGYDFINPVHTVATMAAAGMCLGAFLKSKKTEDKENYISYFISAFIGITEPGLYGVAFRYRRQLYALMIGGGVSGAFVAGMGAKVVAVAMPSWISLPAFAGSIPTMIAGLLIAFILTTVLSYVFGFDPAPETNNNFIDAKGEMINE